MMPSVMDLVCAVRRWARFWLSHKEEESASTMQPLSPVHRAAQRGNVEELRRLIKRVRHSAYPDSLVCVLWFSIRLGPGLQANWDCSLTRICGLGSPFGFLGLQGMEPASDRSS